MWELDSLRNTYIWKGKLEEVHLYQIKILASNKIKGFIKMDMLNKDGICILEYKIDNKISLDKYLEENDHNMLNYQVYIEKLLEAMKTADNYLLSKANVLINPLQIFLDEKSKDIEIIYFPKKEYEQEAIEDLKSLINLIKPLLIKEKTNAEKLLKKIDKAIVEKQSNYNILNIIMKEEEDKEQDKIRLINESIKEEHENEQEKESLWEDANYEEELKINDNAHNANLQIQESGLKKSSGRIIVFLTIQILLGANIWFGFTNFLLEYESYQIKLLLIGAGLVCLALAELLIVKLIFSRSLKRVENKDKRVKEKGVKEKRVKEKKEYKIKKAKESSKKPIKESKWNWYEEEQDEEKISMGEEEIQEELQEEIQEEFEEIQEELEMGMSEPEIEDEAVFREEMISKDIKKAELKEKKLDILIEDMNNKSKEEEKAKSNKAESNGVKSNKAGYEINNGKKDESLILPFERVYLVDSKKVHIPIHKSVFVMGKMKSIADFVIQDNRVSRVHCKIIREGKKCYIYDLESKNGTYVNTLKIQEHIKVPLFDGDKIKIVDYEYTVRFY